MKILIVITRADTVGGAQRHVKDLAHSLIASGNKVLIITGPKGLFTTTLEQFEIPWIECKTLHKEIKLIQDFKTVTFLKEIIKNFQPDIVATHSSKSGILGRLAAKFTNTPCTFTAHGWAFTEGVPEPSRTVYRLLEQLAGPWADRIICVSEYDRSLGIIAGIPNNRLLTIYNGVEDVANELKATPNLSNPVKIVMVARFDKQKDHFTLIEAFKDIWGAELLLVGDGPNLEDIQILVNQLEMTNRVSFLGYRNDIANILSQAQIFTLISNWEGFPLVTLEAMRAGLPVVVSSVGGAAEAVVDGVTGYCVPRSDVGLLRECLKRLVSDPQLRQQMGISGQKRYEEEFTFKRMFEKTVNVYQAILTQRVGNR